MEEVNAAKGSGLTESRLDASVQQRNGKALGEAGDPGSTPVGEGSRRSNGDSPMPEA